MVIVGDNLRALVAQHDIAPDRSVDENSIRLTLDSQIKRMDVPAEAVVAYGSSIPDDWINSAQIDDDGLVLASGECVLACSAETIRMPIGYVGFIQTKGSLARLFVMAHCTDGQVDPGYHGKLTLEFVNLAPFPVRVRAGDVVALLFIHRASTRGRSYAGGYQGASGPTVSRNGAARA